MKKSSERKENARQLILDTSAAMFARKGYDGTSVDAIAKEADVTKSLIYYHFDSKKNILTELIRTLLNSYNGLIKASISDPNVASDEDRYLRFARNNEHLIRVLMVESLKVTEDEPAIFEALETLMSNVEDEAHSQERLIAEFFTNILPAMSYVCYRQAWSAKYGMNIAEQDNLFNKVLQKTHGQYHQ